MKYFEIEKYLCNYGHYFWYVEIKKEFSKDYRYRKNLKLGDKVNAYLNGEIDEIAQNGKTYDIDKTQFTHDGKPVYILSINNIPQFVYYKTETLKKGNVVKTEFVTSTSFIADENVELFESYGYKIKENK